MTSNVVGIGGTLLPERYIAVQLVADAASLGAPAPPAATARRLQAWWERAATRCGPTSPLRVLFDELAMPLLAMLDFTAHQAAFERNVCRTRLPRVTALRWPS